jgi:hypothetical protein
MAVVRFDSFVTVSLGALRIASVYVPYIFNQRIRRQLRRPNR